MLHFVKKLLSVIWLMSIDLTIMLSVFSVVSQFVMLDFDEPETIAFLFGMAASIIAFCHLKFRHQVVKVIQGRWFPRSIGLYGIWMNPEHWAVEDGGTDIVGSKKEMEWLVKEWKNEMPIELFQKCKYEVREYV